MEESNNTDLGEEEKDRVMKKLDMTNLGAANSSLVTRQPVEVRANEPESPASPYMMRQTTVVSKSMIVKENQDTVHDAFKDELMCKLCSNLLQNPQECTQCKENFCKECLVTWLGNENANCPTGCK